MCKMANEEVGTILESKKPKKKGKKFIIALFSLALILAIVVYVCLSGFLPVPGCYETSAPAGNYEEIPLESYIEETPELAEMPNLNKIEHKIWKTDLPSDQIVNSYKQNLSDKGYNLEYDGIVSLDEKEYTALGFLKGLTAVGILVSNDGDVIYATGFATDFIEIVEWYQSQ